MPPAAKSAPYDYLFAIVVCLIVIGTSFLVKPDTTKYVVMITGVVMLVAVAAAAAKPDRTASAPEAERKRSSQH